MTLYWLDEMDRTERKGPTIPQAVTDAVTAATEQTMADLPPLAAIVDTDALTTVATTATGGCTRFDYAGCTVHLPHDADTVAVYVTDADAEDDDSFRVEQDAYDEGTTRASTEKGTLVTRIADAVAEETGAGSVIDLPPLQNAVDTDAVTALIEAHAVSAVEFAYMNCHVRVDGTGSVTALAGPRISTPDQATGDVTEQSG